MPSRLLFASLFIYFPPIHFDPAWICDKCNIAKFRTFEEAEAHEETCDSTYNNIDTNPDDVAESKIPSKKGDSENEDWWTSFAERADKSDLDIKAIEHGGKIVLLLQIIAHSDLIGDKVVVFSQSLTTLSYIEEILNSPDWGGFKLFLPDNIRKQKLGGWRRNQEYLRIDGVSYPYEIFSPFHFKHCDRH